MYSDLHINELILHPIRFYALMEKLSYNDICDGFSKHFDIDQENVGDTINTTWDTIHHAFGRYYVMLKSINNDNQDLAAAQFADEFLIHNDYMDPSGNFIIDENAQDYDVLVQDYEDLRQGLIDSAKYAISQSRSIPLCSLYEKIATDYYPDDKKDWDSEIKSNASEHTPSSMTTVRRSDRVLPETFPSVIGVGARVTQRHIPPQGSLEGPQVGQGGELSGGEDVLGLVTSGDSGAEVRDGGFQTSQFMRS